MHDLTQLRLLYLNKLVVWWTNWTKCWFLFIRYKGTLLWCENFLLISGPTLCRWTQKFSLKDVQSQKILACILPTWSSLVEGGEGLYLPNCPKIDYCPLYTVSIACMFINTTAYHLGKYEPSPPSTKELHGLAVGFLSVNSFLTFTGNCFSVAKENIFT